MADKKTTVKFLQNVSVRGKRCPEGSVVTLEDIIIPAKGENTDEIVLALLQDFENRKLAMVYDGEAEVEVKSEKNEAKNTAKNTGSGKTVNTEKGGPKQESDGDSEYLESLTMDELKELYSQKFGESPQAGESKKNLIAKITVEK